eukprot:8906685-Lingulodinium_polyedra.AAC.1
MLRRATKDLSALASKRKAAEERRTKEEAEKRAEGRRLEQERADAKVAAKVAYQVKSNIFSFDWKECGCPSIDAVDTIDGFAKALETEGAFSKPLILKSIDYKSMETLVETMKSWCAHFPEHCTRNNWERTQSVLAADQGKGEFEALCKQL